MYQLMFIGQILALIVGLVALIFFFVTCFNVEKIRRNVEELYQFERARMIRDGLMSQAGTLYPQKGPDPSRKDVP